MTTSSIRKKTVWALPLAAACYIGCSDNGNGVLLPDIGLGTASRAEAPMRGYSDTTLQGTVEFRVDGDSLYIEAEVSGLEPGKAYGIHVHQFGDCSTPEASGGHFDASEPQPHGNPFDSLDSHHRGDLPNLVTGEDGVGRFEFGTRAMTLDTGSHSVVGRSVVLHAEPDDFQTQPAGGTGERIACGVIALMNGNGGTVIDTTDPGIDTTYLDPLPIRPQGG